MTSENDYEYSLNILKNGFQDYRTVIGKASEDIQILAKMHGINAEVFETEHGEFISHSMHFDEFDNRTIENYKKFGEELYKASGKPVYIYISGVPEKKFNVTKKIQSDAVIIMKINLSKESETYFVLDHIKGLVKNRVKLDSEDLFALSMVPIMGPKEDRRNLRIECLTLWKEINEKGLIK